MSPKIPYPMTARQFERRLEQAEMSQRQFALWLGFAVNSVNRWARGHREIPRYVAVIADLIAKYPQIRP